MKQKSDISIELAKLEDIPALVQLLTELFSIEQDFKVDEIKHAQGLKMLMLSPEHSAVLLARHPQAHIVGMVSVQLVISTAEGAYSAWIEDMIVEPSFRAQGVGRMLLDQVLVWAKQKGATRAQLLVDLDNTPAIGYYDHLGWQTSRLGMRRKLLV